MTTPSFRYKPVDRAILEHPVEHRGFVTVPLDRAEPGLGYIEVFYRLIPTLGGDPLDRSKPVVVVFNGGPGIPASFYRPLDFDYDTNLPAPGGFDRFAFLLRTHRVLIADQRGTDGGSAPLDLDDPGLDPYAVARHFSADSHARDYLAVIEAVVPEGDPFLVIAQSYGGMPGMHFLALPDARRPAGVIFSSAALPYEDGLGMNLWRRREQLRLNLELRAAYPDIAERVARTRAHLAGVGVDPDMVNGLYALLGKGVPGVWEPALVARLDKMRTQTGAEITAEAAESGETASLLNYILSAVNFTPGYTDRSLARHAAEHCPFEPWMLDEGWVLNQTGQDHPAHAALVDALDAAPPPPTPLPSIEELRAAIARSRVLFTVADNDAFVPAVAYLESLEKYLVPGYTEVATLPGGHNAIFFEAGYDALLAWSGASPD